MEAIIVLVVLAILILPVAGIVSYFKTQRMIRESLFDIRSALTDITIKIGQLSESIDALKVHTPKPRIREELPLIQEADENDTALEETSLFNMEREEPEPTSGEKSEPVAVGACESEPLSVEVPEPVEKIGPVKTAETVAMEHQSADTAGKEHVPEDELVLYDYEPTPTPKFIEDIGIILGKIWSWLIVGEEHRRPNISMEYAIASTWLLRLGIIALIGCAGFFLRWSIDRGILGPEGRVVIAVIAGIGLLIAGVRMTGKRYHLLAQGFIGGGIAFLYFATYATGPMYHLLQLPFVFACMTLVTITAGVLAIVTGSQLVAILGIIGGYCTPVLLSTGEPAFVELYAYMLLLSLGVLGIAHKKQWRLLNYLAFVFTWALYFGSLGMYEPQRDFTIAIIFLSLLFILHSFIVYYYNLVKKQPSSLLEVAHLLINGALFAGTSYMLLLEVYGRPWPAVTSIALALFYIAHVYIFLRRRLHDRTLLVVLIGFAGFFTAWTIPLITEKETLTVCWSFMALFFLWTGLRLKSGLMVYMSLLLYMIVAGRLIVWDIPRNFDELDWYGIPVVQYWKGFFARFCTFGLVIASMFGATFIYRKEAVKPSTPVIDEENRLPLQLPKGLLNVGMFIAGVLFLFMVVHLELAAMFSYSLAVRTPVLTLVWVGLGVYTMYHFVRTGHQALFVGAGIIVALTLGKLFLVDFGSWHYRIDRWVYRSDLLESFMRLIDYAAVTTLLVLFFRICRTRVDQTRHELLNYLPVILVFIYATLEINTLFYYKIPLFQAGALSVLWALFAISFLILGIMRTSRLWRYTGLALFAVVVLKVFFFDLAEMETIYRVIAFMVVGILLITGSYVYLKASGKFIQKESEE